MANQNIPFLEARKQINPSGPSFAAVAKNGISGCNCKCTCQASDVRNQNGAPPKPSTSNANVPNSSLVDLDPIEFMNIVQRANETLSTPNRRSNPSMPNIGSLLNSPAYQRAIGSPNMNNDDALDILSQVTNVNNIPETPGKDMDDIEYRNKREGSFTESTSSPSRKNRRNSKK